MTYAISGGRRAVANDEHLALLRQGTAIWNEWRERDQDNRPDLSKADFRGAHLEGVNLRRADVRRVILNEANLGGADLTQADLTKADLNQADLTEADLTSANLTQADLTGANLSRAKLINASLGEADLSLALLIDTNLSGADLVKVHFTSADLRGANLSAAHLLGTNFTEANLSGANLKAANLSNTIFGDVYLGEADGLDACIHLGPSIIDHHTLSQSGNLPIPFLRGCGLPDVLIEYLPSLRGEAIQFYSCFISYSAKDQIFAERLHADLQDKGVRCWFAPHDLPIGAKIWDAIDDAIRLRDKLLVILSGASIASDWVEDEVNKAYAEERARKEVVLFPVRIDNAVMSTAEPWARKLRDQRNIGDFRQWKKPAEYQKNLERLLRDLKTSGKK
jgi:uncharacterized protein YjbI with pentapeptide repeats